MNNADRIKTVQEALGTMTNTRVPMANTRVPMANTRVPMATDSMKPASPTTTSRPAVLGGKTRGTTRAKGSRSSQRRSTWDLDVRGVGDITAADAHQSPLFGRPLTRRELQVLGLARTGRSSLQIAELLIVSKRTVDFHLANCYSKLGVANRIAAINEAVRRGDITL